MEEKMKKIGLEMAVRMGIVMSFFLSLTGSLLSGHFTIVRFLLSFLVSTVISLIIGIVIPMGRITMAIASSLHLVRGSLPEKIISSLVSDIIYTPIMTFIMVFLAYKITMIQSGGMAQLNFLAMFLPSFAICMILGFILCYILLPRFMKNLMKKYNVPEKF